MAGDLRVGIGDRITWDVQGVPVESEVTSIRRVDWAQFEPNFFVVFQPGALEKAPQSFVALARVSDAEERATIQTQIVRRYPNVAVLDLGLVQEALDRVLSKVALAIRFMALFSVGAGIIVLMGAIRVSQLQRMRESALLRTLGATAAQVRAVLLTEFAVLGALSGVTGIVCAGFAGWLLVAFFFELPFELPVVALAAPAAAVTLLTMVVGVVGSRRVVRRTPLEILRETAE
ncbi:MAG: FtsX-like permease family protein [Gemmatimonadetes bacterium]|nr:FtsX-like permease family protein [Gemmatimonadota bacterium]